ncbi:hypothetical protein [Alteromonas sp. ASW11-130]|uniref:hypothetical protein n=1 Tax=Alteromonas sp. ASW11-130 TaxID=3015775 RepID=UPI0022419890|nr:hypothetical protein [Alteromonas sp. ASW11-130]MCW8092735.1 hypothetical protein [Alteromonas sp. ASW11-130]
MKLVTFSVILISLVTAPAGADECTAILDIYIEELKASLDERVDYSQPQIVSNTVIELEFIQRNRNIVPDCELRESILIIDPSDIDDEN